MKAIMLIILFLLVVLLISIIICFPEEQKKEEKEEEEIDVFEWHRRRQYRCNHRDRRQYKNYEICVDCDKKFEYE